MNERRFPLWPILILIVLGALLRVMRHEGYLPLPPNVAPVSAIAFLAAAYLPVRWGWAAPFGLMVASDLVIGGYTPAIMVAVYLSFGLSYLLGTRLRRTHSIKRLVTISLAGSLGFFAVTNTAVWAFSGMYPLTGAGLLSAFAAGLPFLRNTVFGDLAYTSIFFGLSAVMGAMWRYMITARSHAHG